MKTHYNAGIQVPDRKAVRADDDLKGQMDELMSTSVMRRLAIQKGEGSEDGSLEPQSVDVPGPKITPAEYWADLNERMPD
jgi:hypothetical protein